MPEKRNICEVEDLQDERFFDWLLIATLIILLVVVLISISVGNKFLKDFLTRMIFILNHSGTNVFA